MRTPRRKPAHRRRRREPHAVRAWSCACSPPFADKASMAPGARTTLLSIKKGRTTPYFFDDRQPRGAWPMATWDTRSKPSGANMYRRILVAIDASETSQRALEHAVQLAAEQHARLRIVHAVESIEHLAMSFSGGYPVDMTEFMEAQRQEGQRLLAEAQTGAQ